MHGGTTCALVAPHTLVRGVWWVGGQVLNINANKNISSLFSKFGTVKHSTVRVKPGENKSWSAPLPPPPPAAAR
jgi:hypothetical protein